MKKNGILDFLRKRRKSKTWLFMRFLVLFMVVLSMQLSASAYSQVAKVSLQVEHASFERVIRLLEKSSDYTFLYEDNHIASIKDLNLNYRNVDIKIILDECLKGTGLTYRLMNRTVVIQRLHGVPVDSIQKITLSGIVKDQRGFPLPGVTVQVKRTTLGVATNEDGKFRFELPRQDSIILIFSFVGMESQEVFIKEPSKMVNVVMKEDAKALEDVVVTGYANVKKSSFTGTAIRVEKKDLLKVASRNIISALQVFDPSLRVMKNNEMGSDPNTVPEFYIRGRSGVGVMELDKASVSKATLQNNPNSPLFIMDGYEVTIDKVYDFDPNRIQNVTILKDAAATALYGSRAANGVIVIETVAPMPGKLRVSYDFTAGLTAPDISDYNLMNAEEKLEAERLAGFYDYDENLGISTYQSLQHEYAQKMNNVLAGVNTDWLSKPLENQFSHKHSFFIEGGGEEIRFGITMRYDSQNGVMRESGRDRVGAGFMLDYRMKKLQIRNEVSYDVTKGKNSPYGDFSEYTKRLPYVAYKDEAGNYKQELGTWQSASTRQNPFYEAKVLHNFSNNNYSTLTDNLGVNWYPMQALQVKVQFSITKQNNWSTDFTDPESAKFISLTGDLSQPKGLLTKSDSESLNWTFKTFGNYVETLGDHNINFSLGIEMNEGKYSGGTNVYRGFPSGDLNSPEYAEKSEKPSFSDNHTRLFSGFAALNYSYKDIYLLDASCRLDGSSEFGADNKTAPFYSFGLGLNLHKYGFLLDNDLISQLRFTGTYGQTGKVNFPPYAAKHTYVISDKYYGTGNGVHLYYMGNDNLTWEKTNEFNLRMNVGLWKDLVTLEADWYNKVTKDLITDVTVPVSTGFESYKDNLGEVRNRGFELILRANVYQNQHWDVIFYGNLAHNENRIMKISESLKAYNSRVDEEFNKFNDNKKDTKFTKPLMKYIEGGSLTSIWGMESLGINPSDGKEIYVNRDGGVSYDWVSSEQQVLGDTQPDAQGSFGLNLRFKNFSLFASFLYEFGGQTYNSTLADKVECVDLRYENADKRVLTQRWNQAGQRTKLKDIKDRSIVTRPTARFVQNMNTVDFNSLSISYDFNSELIQRWGLSMLRLQVQTESLAHFSSVKQERGLSYPFARTFNFSLNATF